MTFGFSLCPPHTTQNLNPLDKTVFGPFQRQYNRQCTDFMSASPNNMVTKWEWPRLFKAAYVKAVNKENTLKGFEVCGIPPFNPYLSLSQRLLRLYRSISRQRCRVPESHAHCFRTARKTQKPLWPAQTTHWQWWKTFPNLTQNQLYQKAQKPLWPVQTTHWWKTCPNLTQNQLYQKAQKHYSSSSRGVAILFKNSFKYEIHKSILDENGNYIILDITLQEQRLTLGAIYGVNEDNPTFYRHFFSLIETIDNTSIILGGDWNAVLDYDLDTRNYRGKNNMKSQREIIACMNSFDLEDCWRALNPEKRRYTWRGPHSKQARLDYFLVSTDLQPAIEHADIGISYKSDHSPIELALRFNDQVRGRGTWKFNNTLLSDMEYVNQIKSCIQETLDIYRVRSDASHDQSVNKELDNYNIDDQLLWETLKLAIRGKTISYSSYKKRQSNKREEQLIRDIKKHHEQLDNSVIHVEDGNVEQLEAELKQIREFKAKGIMMRAKARWKVEGEKSTRYFCNLEKRHYNEKLISKLITESGEETKDITCILKEQHTFYKGLYSSRNVDTNSTQFNSFFDDTNPFINKLSEYDSSTLEGPLNITECLNALKNMKQGKSPGLDGFTAEFFKFFWSDLGHFLLRSFNLSYEKKCMSVTQRQGVITCIPKQGKPKQYLKNWRPITLLNVDQKIASAAIANRLKKIIKKIITETQTGFIKGRYMGECNRLILDILDITEKENIPGIMLLIDFEKAFDSVEWEFIEQALIFYGFGQSIINWFKTFYSELSSCITNNGHLSDFFPVQRGVRQGDPLSPYLFIIAVELLSAALKYNPDIKGIQIHNSSFLISQYADDSTLLLSDDEVSLNTTLNLIESFARCSGLKANFDKTQAVWIGARRGCGEELRTDKMIKWNHEGVFKLLGLQYNLNKSNFYLDNFHNAISSITNLLNNWCFRNITLIGKVAVVKTLAIPILLQVFTTLPSPPPYIYKQINDIIFSFIWDKKGDKIKRTVIINSHENGGLNLPHIETFCQSLKYSWIKKLVDVTNNSPWKVLVLDKMEKFGGDKMWYLTKEGLKKASTNFNPFWRDLILSWSDLPRPSPAAPTELQSQPLWLNCNIKINKKTVFWKKWIKNSIFFINDIMKENGNFLSLEEIAQRYNIQIPFTEYFGLVAAIPKEWKTTLQNANRLEDVDNYLITILKKNIKVTKPLYKIKLETISEIPALAQEKWTNAMQIQNTNENPINWNQVYSLTFRITEDAVLQNFQFKLLHRIIFTNRRLFLCQLSETELCSFCGETRETLAHLFFNCPFVRTLRFEFKDILKTKCDIDDKYILNIDSFILGIAEPNTPTEDCLNIIFMLMKYFIYSCKIKRISLSTRAFIEKLNQYKNLEFHCRYMYTTNKSRRITERWTSITQILS